MPTRGRPPLDARAQTQLQTTLEHCQVVNGRGEIVNGLGRTWHLPAWKTEGVEFVLDYLIELLGA